MSDVTTGIVIALACGIVSGSAMALSLTKMRSYIIRLPAFLQLALVTPYYLLCVFGPIYAGLMLCKHFGMSKDIRLLAGFIMAIIMVSFATCAERRMKRDKTK